jgi:hypothetical protein
MEESYQQSNVSVNSNLINITLFALNKHTLNKNEKMLFKYKVGVSNSINEIFQAKYLYALQGKDIYLILISENEMMVYLNTLVENINQGMIFTLSWEMVYENPKGFYSSVKDSVMNCVNLFKKYGVNIMIE